MDRELFSRMIRELLLRDGCVELPGMGSLQLQTFPASFSDRGFTLNPPFKKLVFVSSPDNARGEYAAPRACALSSLYASANGISQQRAITAIREALQTITQSVSPTQDFLLPGIGRFRRLRDGSLFFVQSQDVNLCPSFDSLPGVSLKSLDQTAADPQDAPLPAFAPAASPEPSRADPADSPRITAPSARRKQSRAGKIALWTTCAILLLLFASAGLLAVLGRTRPQLVDPVLYDAQQLDVLYPENA